MRVGHGAKQPTSARSPAVLISSINNLKVQGETHMRISQREASKMGGGIERSFGHSLAKG